MLNAYRFDGSLAYDAYPLGPRFQERRLHIPQAYVCSTLPLPSTEAVFTNYQAWCTERGIVPADREMYERESLVLIQQEIKRHESDEFVASLHPDGGNLAGFHGVRGNEDDD